MAEEPQPSNIHEGQSAPDAPPATADDRATAKAMDSLDAKADESAEPKKELDMKAINDAMKNLEAVQGGGDQEKKKAEQDSEARKAAVEKVRRRQEEEARRKAVKVDQGVVAVMVRIGIEGLGCSDNGTNRGVL